MSRWWRAYDEAVDDPKLQRLGAALGWAWFNLMCIASKHDGVLPPIGDVAFKLRMTEQRAAATITALVTAGLFENIETGFAPHNWNARQYKSDVSTDRVKRFRKQERNVSETPPETEQRQTTEAETDKTSLRSERAPPSVDETEPKPARPKRANARTPLPDAWTLDETDFEFAVSRKFLPPQIMRMADAFANHHRAKGSLMADWHAAWRTWCANEIKFNGGRNGNGTANSRTTGHDAILAAASRKARALVGDGGVAGAGDAAEFPFGNGADGRGAQAMRDDPQDDRRGDFRRELDGGPIIEGEVVAADENAAGIPGRR